jgi:hypothetical protein
LSAQLFVAFAPVIGGALRLWVVAGLADCTGSLNSRPARFSADSNGVGARATDDSVDARFIRANDVRGISMGGGADP